MSVDFDTAGKPIECTAAVAWAPKEDLKLETIIVAPPKAGEVRLKVLYNSLCHTDFYTLSGLDAEGVFPCILGHEGAGIVESVGEGVTSVQPGDVVVPAYTPECKSCKYCTSKKTNLCPKIRATQGKGLMPDGTTRFTSKEGKEIFHFMGCSTLAQYTVCAEISVVKVNPDLDPAKICLMGCGVTTGVGAALKTANVEEGSTCAVIGLGGVGLAAIKGCQMAGAKRIFAIDTNPAKFDLAKKMGATDCVNPKELERPVEDYIVEQTEGGVDYAFEAVGSVHTMKQSILMAARGWGVSTLIGVAPAGAEVSARPFLFITGRTLKGTAFGGVKSRSELPEYIDKCYDFLDDFITANRPLNEVNDGFHDMHNGVGIRTVINMWQ